MSPRVNALVGVREESERFAYTDELARRHLYSVGVRFRGGHALALSFAVQRLGSPGGAGTGRYSENRLLASIAYAPGSRAPSLFDPFRDFRYFTRYQTNELPGVDGPVPE